MKQYHDHLKTIINKGSYKEPAREGMPGSISLFGYQCRYDLQQGFPILTTKKINFKNIVVELLWFLRGDTNIKYLVDNGCNIWNEDAYNYYVKKAKIDGISNNYIKPFDIFITKIKTSCEMFIDHNIHNYKLGDCGFQYGKVWRKWNTNKTIIVGHTGTHNEWGEIVIDQLAKVINNIKTKPFDRRKVITAVDPTHDEDLALYWCHCLFQFNCRRIEDDIRAHWAVDNLKMHRNEFMFPDNIQNRTLEEQLDDNNIPKYYLDCHMYQRSADMFLGVPYNISSYALLTHIIAKICNMIPGEFIHSFGDSHIYDNHKEQVTELLSRDVDKYKLPKLSIDHNIDWTKFENTKEQFLHLTPEDFELENYESYPAIKAELSTGLKK